MLQINFILYAGLFLVALFSECSSKVNTRTVGRKVGLLLITVGALLQLAERDNYFIVVGVLVYLTSNILGAYLNRQRRRQSDIVNRLNRL